MLGLFKIQGLCLSEVPVSMPRLRHLHLEQCNEVIDLLLESLARRLPELQVFNYYGEKVVPFESSPTGSLLGDVSNGEFSFLSFGRVDAKKNLDSRNQSRTL